MIGLSDITDLSGDGTDIFAGAPAPGSGAFDTGSVYNSWDPYANSGGGGYIPSGGPIPSSGSGGSFWTALASAFGSAGKILGTRYSVPQLNPGQFISTNAQGTTMYQLAPGQTSLPLSTSALTSSLTSWLPIMLAVGAGIMLLNASKK